jgi:ABC-type uncharacterized transport system permease subunit
VLREDYRLIGPLTLPVRLFAFTLAGTVWRRGVARYEGAGS